ncbi:hypothetical protein EV363DRAFT_1168655 [Boletus edulis]|nr:hypothetical protein EV363DRAFT_1168655 [Boletus edulis]
MGCVRKIILRLITQTLWSFSTLLFLCLTHFCCAKPTYQRSKYCSRTCADCAATMCKHCRTEPRARRQGSYCLRT